MGNLRFLSSFENCAQSNAKIVNFVDFAPQELPIILQVSEIFSDCHNMIRVRHRFRRSWISNFEIPKDSGKPLGMATTTWPATGTTFQYCMSSSFLLLSSKIQSFSLNDLCEDLCNKKSGAGNAPDKLCSHVMRDQSLHGSLCSAHGGWQCR